VFSLLVGECSLFLLEGVLFCLEFGENNDMSWRWFKSHY